MNFGYSVRDILAILKLADELKKRFSQAPKQFSTISEEVKRVWTVLHDIDDIPVDGLDKSQRHNIQAILEGCQEVLEDLKVKLDKSHVLAYKSSDWKVKAHQAWSRITWDQAEIDRLRDRITSTISLFNLLMNKINQYDPLNLLRYFYHAAYNTKIAYCLSRGLSLEIRNDTRRLLEKSREDSSKSCFSFLSSIDSSRHQAEILSGRQAGTGNWFINKKEFQAWLHQESQLLYCPGIPGAGKAVLCSVAIDCLERSFANSHDIGITYIFFDFRQQLSLAEILAVLLRQLLQGTAEISDTWSLRTAPKESMNLEWMQSKITTIALELAKSFIVIDALQRKANVNILATSRFNEETANMFTTGEITEIQADDNDIRASIDHRLTYFSPFVTKKVALLTYIRDEIVKSSRGMFLLAKLYVNLLQDEINEKQLRKVIERFKNGRGAYDDAYDETMERIEHQGEYAQNIAKTVFGWVLFSTRLLPLTEIQHALAVKIGESEFDNTNITDIEQLISICIGLVTIDSESNSLKFVHYTTKEYFERKLDKWFPDIHRVIASTCFTYVSLGAFDKGPYRTIDGFDDRLRDYPFYRYSAQNWGHHYQKYFGEKSAVIEFLAAESKVHASCQAIFGVIDDAVRVPVGTHTVIVRSNSSVEIKEPLTGPHLAAFFGITSILESMLSSNMIKADIEDHAGRTPLSWAAAYGHEELVRTLLKADANADSMNQFGFTPLYYAAVSGKVRVIQSLIDAGAQVNTVDQNGRTPLFHAAAGESLHLIPLAFEGDCFASVQLLFDHGGSVTQVDNFGQTPLFAAASRGRESIVRFLIEKDAHLYYATSPVSVSVDPLAYAAMNGHAMTAKLLFEAGAYSMCKHSGENAYSYVTLANLLNAGSEGRDDDFKYLKEEGANPEVRDSYQRLPLHWAALRGDENLLKCLLKNGADVNAKEIFGRTPLFYAIFGAQPSATLLLLDFPGVDFQGTDIFGYSPLVQSRSRRAQKHQWKCHNLLKIKSGEYDGLFLNDTAFELQLQSAFAGTCDACLQYNLHVFRCGSCTTLPEEEYLRSSGAKYCSSCVSTDKPSQCPLCGHALEVDLGTIH